ncbi:MAG: CoA transferase subunit A [Lachnospiraceae bacterium]|nr:CoA transferase subunit A [Lachnospiraceae bacterium]
MNKVISKREAIAKVKDGMSLMVGGFNTGGDPNELVEALRTKTDVKGLTLINIDAGVEGSPLTTMLEERRFKKVIGSFFGANKEIQKQADGGLVEYELCPQGTFAERIRAAGAGLGGILTPTGVGTVVENGKQKITIDGKEYLLETALSADVALIRAEVADESGNLVMVGNARNTNTVMAMAAKYVVAQANKIVKIGEIDPDDVTVAGIFVDAVVYAGEEI